MITINIAAIGAFIFKTMTTVLIVSFTMMFIFEILSGFTDNIIINNIKNISYRVCGVTFLTEAGLLGMGVVIAIILGIWA